MEAIEALVDCHWDQDVVELLEERIVVHPELRSIVGLCVWDAGVPEPVQDRLARLASHQPPDLTASS
jgi:hypothetical protein